MWDSRAKEIIWGFWKILPHEQGEFGVSTTTLWDCHYRASKEEHGRWGLEVGILEASNDWDEGCYKLGVYKKKKKPLLPSIMWRACAFPSKKNNGVFKTMHITWD